GGITRLRQLPPPRRTPLQRSLRAAAIRAGSMVGPGADMARRGRAVWGSLGAVRVIDTRAVAPLTRAWVARQNEHSGGSPGGAARPQRRPPVMTPTQRPGRARTVSVATRPALTRAGCADAMAAGGRPKAARSSA